MWPRDVQSRQVALLLKQGSTLARVLPCCRREARRFAAHLRQVAAGRLFAFVDNSQCVCARLAGSSASVSGVCGWESNQLTKP
jgi:hypothetical protein